MVGLTVISEREYPERTYGRGRAAGGGEGDGGFKGRRDALDTGGGGGGWRYRRGVAEAIRRRVAAGGLGFRVLREGKS